MYCSYKLYLTIITSQFYSMILILAISWDYRFICDVWEFKQIELNQLLNIHKSVKTLKTYERKHFCYLTCINYWFFALPVIHIKYIRIVVNTVVDNKLIITENASPNKIEIFNIFIFCTNICLFWSMEWLKFEGFSITRKKLSWSWFYHIWFDARVSIYLTHFNVVYWV